MADLTPVTRKEHFLSRAAGGPGLELEPITREEHFLAAIAEAGPSPGPGGEVTPASIVTATGQMDDDQKSQTRDNLRVLSVDGVEDTIVSFIARQMAPMTVDGGNLVLDLERWGGIENFVQQYSSGLNAVFALPMLYLDQTAANTDILAMQLIGLDQNNGVFHFEGVRGEKRYYARMTPIDANVLSGPLVITDNTTTPASIITATGQMTDAQKADTRTNLNVVSTAIMGAVYNRLDALEGTTVTVEGTDPTITPAPNTIYNCGTLTSLTITNPPATGKFWIWFTSGATATVVTGIDNFTPEANKVYRISVENGYATYDSWSVGGGT